MSTPPAVPTFRRSLLQASIALLGATALGIAACGGGGGGGDGDQQLGTSPPLESSQSASTTGTATLLATLNDPWGLAFLPDGRMVVTEKGGSMALVDGGGANVVRRLSGVPAVDARGQGGLLDVVYRDGWLYFAYSEPGANDTAGTALARAQLNSAATGLQNFAVLWRQEPKVATQGHYGARIAFAGDGTMYLAVGERNFEANNGTATANGPQSAATGIGKVLRLNADGSVPAGNPSFGAGATAGLWSTGHRNPQGAAVRPGTNELWITEHGPQGGDELNRVAAGGNFGWPLKSYGCNYGAPQGAGCRIGGGTHAPDFVEPKAIWVPTSTAPSGLMWYDANGSIAEWRGSLFSGALAGTSLWRIVVDGNGNATSRQEIQAVRSLGLRIRDVRQGPDGHIYLLGGNRIVRLAP
jgi:glucose/arabinose dehydrogenase